ncbi:MAG: homospermidine synthase, partial [Halocynthiibacter sp.]
MSKTHPIYARINGPIILIGFGSIGRGTLPLIERHFEFDREKLVIIEPNEALCEEIKARGIRHIKEALTPDNYRAVLGDLFEPGAGFVVNLSVDTSSLDLMKFCRENGVLYIDTVVEPWAGFYFDTEDNAARTNYALRETVRREKAANPGGTTAVSCCGANPGMVSWFVKEALLTLAKDTGQASEAPTSRSGWAKLMQSLGVQGVHIAERDTQTRQEQRQPGHFVNTWSVEGFIAEGFQPAELGWGT